MATKRKASARKTKRSGGKARSKAKPKARRKTAPRARPNAAAKPQPKAPTLAKPPARPAPTTRGAAPRGAAGTAVTMSISFPSGDPGDVMKTMRIDGETLPASGKTSIGAGRHTTGWDVISPTVKPIDFAVTIAADATGAKLLDRSSEKTGNDGQGAGADRFEA